MTRHSHAKEKTMTKLFRVFAMVLALMAGTTARAGIPVIDAGNLSQNILSALQTLQSNVNEATQIANQMQSIANQVKNLQQMPNSLASNLLTQYTSQYTQLTSSFNTINGLARDVANLNTKYQSMFPDRNVGGTLTTAGVNTQIQQWLDQSRRTIRGVYSQSGQVMAALPQTTSQINDIVAQAQASNGGLDAQQAQTQMSAQVAHQLVQLNAQMAGMYQAQGDMMAQQQQMQDVARRRAADSRVNFTTASTQPAAAYLPSLH
jgi:type IV secretion system protein TrbJ